MMSAATSWSASSLTSALVAWPSLIHLSVPAPGPVPEVCVHCATYSVPADRSALRSATNMNRPPLVASSPISAVRWSGIICTSSCEMRPMQ
ncbi:hypothetical protein G6F35_017704 [Rhizopus arrhizus]|nr:hypothetical protein G6F35_017704 [Rhizopus arrhizus]